MLNIVTGLCNRSPELFRLAKCKLCTHETTLISPYPRPVATTILLSVSEFHYSRYLIQVDGRFFNLRFPFCCAENCLSSATSYISLVLLFWTNVRSSKSLGIVIWQCSCQGKHEASQHSRREIQLSAAILRSGQAIWSHDRRSSLENQKYYQNVFLISEACLNPGFGRPFLCRSR